MSTVVNKSLEDHGTSEDSVESCKTAGENVTMSTTSVRSSVSQSAVEADANSSLVESSQDKKESEKLQAHEKGEEEADVEQTDILKPAPQSHVSAAVTELSVQMNDNSTEQVMSKQSSSDGTANEADYLRKAENSILTDSRHGSRLSVRSEVLEESVNLLRDGSVDEVHVSDNITASTTSLRSQKSHTQHKVTKNKTDKYEASSQAASLVLVRCDESQNITESSTAVETSASRTSLRSTKRRTKNENDKSETEGVVASLASVRSDKLQIVTESNTEADITASRSSLRSLKPQSKKPRAKNKNDKSETSSTAASLVSVRSDKSQNVAESNTAVDITASRTSVKSRTVHEMTESQIGRSEVDSLEASVLSPRSDEAQEVDDDCTKATSQALSHGENARSQLSVRPSANTTSNQHSGDVDADSNVVLGSMLSIKSLNSEVSSNSSSVVISKPPKPVAVNKAMKDAQPAAEAKTLKTGHTTGDSFSFLLHLCDIYVTCLCKW